MKATTVAFLPLAATLEMGLPVPGHAANAAGIAVGVGTLAVLGGIIAGKVVPQ
jgi:hypothetical protein